MQVLVDTAEEEANIYKAKIAELEQAVKQVSEKSANSTPEVCAYMTWRKNINGVLINIKVLYQLPSNPCF